MAMTNLFRSPDWLRRHFLIRVAGLSGALVGGLGLVLWSVGLTWLGVIVALLGFVAAGGALVVEIGNAAELVSARRGTAGSLSAAQVLLAAVLLVEVNAFSFFHYHRFDWTRDREFTIEENVRKQLGRLRGETIIVLHLKHNFGRLSNQRDEYDHAAERVVIDKIEDVAEQFREFGPQFRVVVLDVKDKNYRHKLKDLAEQSPALADALRASTEDSIVIAANDKVQRLGFQELFQLNKKASQEANGGRGNLVLNYQGEEPFARKLLNLDERKPRVALGVILDVFSSEGRWEEYTMSGLRKALVANGFEVRDVILKQFPAFTPTVLTFDENRYEELEKKIAAADRTLKVLRAALKDLAYQLRRFQSPAVSLKDLNKEFGRELREEHGVETINEPIRQRYVAVFLKPNIEVLKVRVEQAEKEEQQYRKQQRGLNVTGLAEQRRLTDLKAKLELKLADCDLLILPRMTLLNVANRANAYIPNELYQLDPGQVEAIQDFLKKGKPVLALFGPTSDPSGMPADVMHRRNDGLEMMLARLGIRLGHETVLFRSELESFGEQRGEVFIFHGTEGEVPPASFSWNPGARARQRELSGGSRYRPHPIAESMRLTVAGLDEKATQELRIKHPRPVEPGLLRGTSRGADSTFLMTDASGWKEARPFPQPQRGYTPKPPPRATRQVSIGVAVEAWLPADWRPEQKRVRVAAIGNGGVFSGSTLSPVREKLLLDTCNWLLGRDDLLSRDNIRWQFPRVELSGPAEELWLWWARLLLPLLFGYVGIVVLMKRRLR
jgi:hypothetical protein